MSDMNSTSRDEVGDKVARIIRTVEQGWHGDDAVNSILYLLQSERTKARQEFANELLKSKDVYRKFRIGRKTAYIVAVPVETIKQLRRKK